MIDQYMTYVIFFHNQDEYNFAVAAVGGTPASGGILNRCPVMAHNAFGIPYPFPTGDMDTIDKGVYYIPPYVPGTQINPFPPPYITLTDNLDWFDIPGMSSSQSWGRGEDVRMHWAGSIVYMKGATPNDPLNITPIPQRRWLAGLELAPPNEDAALSITNVGCRDSSRTIDGLGMANRGTLASTWTKLLATLNPGYTSNRSWERFYFRIRRLPTSNSAIWYCKGNVFPAAGSILRITPTGAIQLCTIDAISTITVLNTSGALTLDKWYKCDVILKFDSSGGANHGLIMLYLNGIQIFTSTGFDMDSNNLHIQSILGNASGAADAQFEIDFDDWINADWPINTGVLSLDSIDWLMGSHVRRVYTISGTTVGYTPTAPSWAIMNQGHNPDADNSSVLSSATASSVLTGTAELPALGVQDKAGEVAVGPVAMVVTARTTNSLNTDGQLGYSIAGGGAVMATVDEITTIKAVGVIYRPSQNEPSEITPLVVRYTKSADGATANIRALQALVEYIGVWGQEDVSDPSLFADDLPRNDWIHNCRYPNTNYGIMAPTPLAMVYAVGGTYTGNGTQQEITLPDACHFLLIRGLTVAANGIKVIGTAIGGHLGTTERVVPNAPNRLYYDSTSGTFKFQISGTGAEINQNAIVYQYIAFCDPGMRFSCAGAYHANTNVTSRSHNLQNPSFTPEFMFVQRDALGGLSNTLGMWSRGPGNTGTDGNGMDTNGIINFGSFGLGTYTSGAGVHGLTNAQYAYIGFRSTEPNCGWIAVQCTSYVGNGTNPRTINLTPVSGRYPLFVLVCPTSGSQPPLFRDPSHAGANSSSFTSVNSTNTTGITGAGMDTITVNSLLNANGITYNVFCIPGSTLAAFVNGTYWPPNCDASPSFYNPVMVPPDAVALGNGGLTLDGSTTITMLKNISGIYTLVPGKTNDTMYDRQSGQASVDVKIPDPTAKTGYIGG